MVFQAAVLQRHDFLYLPFKFRFVKFLQSEDACGNAPQFEICIIHIVAFNALISVPFADAVQYTHFPPEFTLW